jgi:preprotein translocase subunit SecB
MIMTEKYKILGQYIKDLSSETPDVETYLYVRDYISKYQLGIDITSKALKNKMIEVNTTFNFRDKSNSKKKSIFDIVFATIIQVNEDNTKKEQLEKIILCDLQVEIYPKLEKALLNLLHSSGYPNIKFDKKVDFENLYNQRFN